MRRTVWKKVLCNERTPVKPTEAPKVLEKGIPAKCCQLRPGQKNKMQVAGPRTCPGRKPAPEPGGVRWLGRVAVVRRQRERGQAMWGDKPRQDAASQGTPQSRVALCPPKTPEL